MAKEKHNTKTTAPTNETAMWILLNKIWDFIMPHLYRLAAIPKWLMSTLIFTIIVGAGYLGYTKFYTAYNIKGLYAQVNNLNKRIDNVLSTNEYEVDMEYMILTLYLLEELNELQYQITKSNTFTLIRHMKHTDPTNPEIAEIESSLDRLEQLHIALKMHFRLGIKKFDPSGKLPEKFDLEIKPE